MAHKSVYIKKLGSGRVVRRTLVGIYGDWVLYETKVMIEGHSRIERHQIQLASWKSWLWGAKLVK